MYAVRAGSASIPRNGGAGNLPDDSLLIASRREVELVRVEAAHDAQLLARGRFDDTQGRGDAQRPAGFELDNLGIEVREDGFEDHLAGTGLATIGGIEAEDTESGNDEVVALRFEPGKMTLAATGWSDVQIEQFKSVLRPAGFQVDFGEGRLVVSRARGGATS